MGYNITANCSLEEVVNYVTDGVYL